MKTFDKKVIVLYTLLASYLLIVSFSISHISGIYSEYLNPIFWLVFSIISIIIFSTKKLRFKGYKDKLQIIFIVMLAYIVLYFLSGLLFEFAKNMYSTKPIGILKNIYMFALVLLFKEIVREKMVHFSGERTIFLVLITLLFIISDIEIFNISYYFESSEMFFKYFFSTIFPTITSNVVCTYLVFVGGFNASSIYRLILMLIKLIVPIQPNLDWFMLGLFEGILPVVIYLFVSRYHAVRTNRKNKRDIKDSKPLKKIILITVLIIFGFFVGGIFKIMPVAVISGSMEPIFYRGDVVIVEKIKEDNCNKLKLYDIIEYRLDDRIVLHRITDIKEEEGNLVFTTKGDNNELVDDKPVMASQVMGRIKFRIRYIGYPSVLLNEYFQK